MLCAIGSRADLLTARRAYQESVVLLWHSVGEVCRLYSASLEEPICDKVYSDISEYIVRVSHLIRLIDEKQVRLIIPRPRVDVCRLRIIA